MKLALSITIGAAALVVAGFVGLALLPVLTAEEVGWDTPLSREAALRRLDITYSFPQSAHDIYLRQRREGTQQNFLYVRFSVEPSEVEHHIDEITSTYRGTFPDERSHRITLPTSSSPSVGWFPQPPRWWQARHIAHGFLIRFTHDFGPVFWFDADHNVLYHYERS